MKRYDMIRIVRNNPQRLDALTRAVPVTIKGDGPFEVLDMIDGNILFIDDTGEMQRVMTWYVEVVEPGVPSALVTDDDYAMQMLDVVHVSQCKGLTRDTFLCAAGHAWDKLTEIKSEQAH